VGEIEMVNGFIINRKMSERNGKPTMIYLLQHEVSTDSDGRKTYLNPKKGEVRNYTDEELIAYTRMRNIELYNAQEKDGKIIARDASLNRFEQQGYIGTLRPYTVCAEIRSDKGILLGYRVASARSGDVKAVSVETFISACEKMIIDALKASNNPKELYKPVQNMKFSPNINKLMELAEDVSVAMKNLLISVCVKSGVDMSETKASFLSIYNTSNPLPVEVWATKHNEYSTGKKTTPAMQNNAEKVANKTPDIATIFTKEQLQALAEAKAMGVDIKKLANPELSASRMRKIGNLEADGFNGEQLNNPAWKDIEFDYLAANIRLGVDVSEVLNPAYEVKQMTVILAGIMEGLDVNKYSNPSIPYEIMAQKHRDMLDKSTWCTELGILEGTKYTF
jgi:hypothetical protein